MPSELTVLTCLSVTQPLGTFYLVVMKAGELLQRVEILRHGLDEETEEYVQRELSVKRKKEIAAYLTDPDAAFPTAIIVAADPLLVHARQDGRELWLGRRRASEAGEFPDLPQDPGAELEPLDATTVIGSVIDGQHRLMGLEHAGARDPSSEHFGFELPVVFMIGLDNESKALVFSTINSKQVRVSSSLTTDLFGLSATRSPRKTCHQVAAALNAVEGGPFYRTLKMLGKKQLPSESLTQGSFAKYLLPLISRTPDEDARDIKLGRTLVETEERAPLRRFFLDDRDDMIVRVLTNYFGAVRERYPVAWNDADNYALRRTVGFAALMHAFPEVWRKLVIPGKKATSEVFLMATEKFVEAVPEAKLQNIPSNGAAVIQLSKDFTRLL